MWFSELPNKELGSNPMKSLTDDSSSTSITVEENGGDVVIYVDNQRMSSVREAALTAGVEEAELWSQLLTHGLPAYRIESAMLIDYAKDYWLAAEQLVSTQLFKPPFLFSVGHAFELAMKAVLVYGHHVRIDALRRQYGHNLSDLWREASRFLNGEIIITSASWVEDYSKIYEHQMGDAKFFVRYPNRGHLYARWPDTIRESVNSVANNTSVIIGWLNSTFRANGWQFQEWPNKAVNWTP